MYDCQMHILRKQQNAWLKDRSYRMQCGVLRAAPQRNAYCVNEPYVSVNAVNVPVKR